MKRPLFVNRTMREYDLNEQNKYLGNKINTIKSTVKSSTVFKYKNNKKNKLIINSNLSNKNST